MRYSLRTLLILMLLVGPLCIFWGRPAFETWRVERARATRVAGEIKRLKQSIASLELQWRNLGGADVHALTGTESNAELSGLEFKLQLELQRIQMNAQMVKMQQQREQDIANGRTWIQTESLLLFEGSAEELREHLGQPAQEPSQP